MYLFLFLISALVLAFSSSQETRCENLKNCKNINVPVCGSDGRTYGSICLLELSACQTGRQTTLKVACNGLCPCKDSEFAGSVPEKLLRETLRTDSNVYEHLKLKADIKDISLGKCPVQELKELPVRLIDWFHVLKYNQRQQEFKDQNIEGEDVLPKMKFVEAKMKALYSKLACTPQKNTETAQLVCLEPVKWMFNELDGDSNNALNVEELKDIEHINNENCIKPFIDGCDTDKDGYVVLQEFCACLCTTPPCTKAIDSVPTIMMGDEPRPIGRFIPTCDEDGFFAPMQCNIEGNCWCVDRNGAEIKGTRKNGEVDCNTVITNQHPKNLIALDMRKENEEVS